MATVSCHREQDKASPEAFIVVVEAHELLITFLETDGPYAELLAHPALRLVVAEESSTALTDGPAIWAQVLSSTQREERIRSLRQLRQVGVLSIAAKSTYTSFHDAASHISPYGSCWATIALGMATGTPILTTNPAYGVGLHIWHPDFLLEYLKTRHTGGPRWYRSDEVSYFDERTTGAFSRPATSRAVAHQPLSDEECVTQVLAGNDLAFDVLVNRYYARLLRASTFYFHDRDAAEEAVQDTFVKAFHQTVCLRDPASNLDSLRYKATFTWLFAILSRCRDDILRRRPYTIPLHEATSVGYSAEYRDIEFRLRLQQELEKLSKKEREAFLLVYLSGYSRQEAASLAGIAPSTMRNRVGRARAHLAQGLQDYRIDRCFSSCSS